MLVSRALDGHPHFDPIAGPAAQALLRTLDDAPRKALLGTHRTIAGCAAKNNSGVVVHGSPTSHSR